MSVLGIIRIAAVVSLSAIKIASAVLKVKEAKDQGLINPIFVNNNNGTPYCQPVNNNMYCNNQPVQQVPQPVAPAPDSRRFAMNNNYQPTQTYSSWINPMNCRPQNNNCNNYNNYNNQYDTQSRRNVPMNYNNYMYNNQMNVNPTTNIQPTWGNYNTNTHVTYSYPYGPSTTNMNYNYNYNQQRPTTNMNTPVSYSYPYGNGNNYNNNNYYRNNNNFCPPPNQGYQPPNTVPGPQWMMKPRNQIPPQPVPKNQYGTLQFNWNSSPWLKPGHIDSNGVSHMFGDPNGNPVYGPPNPLAEL